MTLRQLSDLPPPPVGKTGWPWTEMSQGSDNPDNGNCTCPRISIVTPSYNQGKYIEETIRSVLLQDYPNLEYIVIDGGSSDSTLQILKKYDRFIRWISEPDEGQTDAINKGLKMASGEIVAYLNSDDRYEPGTFMRIASFFCQQDDVAMVYGDILHIDEDSHVINTYSPGKIRLEEYIGCCVYLPQPTVFFRKQVMEEIGFFDTTFNLAMDLDYWMRIFLRYKTEYIPLTLAAARLYPEAKSSALTLGYLNEHLLILNKIFADPSPLLSATGGKSDICTLKRGAYGAVHFLGGLNYLRKRHFLQALYPISIGISRNPRFIFREELYWSMVVSVTGESGYERIKYAALPRLLKRILTLLSPGNHQN